MKILLDSSVWILYFNKSDLHHVEAERNITSALNKNDNIPVPDLVYIEVLNNVWRLTKRRDAVDHCKTVFHEGLHLLSS